MNPKKQPINLSPEDLKLLVQFFELLIEFDQKELITDHAKEWHAQKIAKTTKTDSQSKK